MKEQEIIQMVYPFVIFPICTESTAKVYRGIYKSAPCVLMQNNQHNSKLINLSHDLTKTFWG